VYRVLVGKPDGKRPLGRPGIDGRIILEWIFRKWDVGVWTGLGWLSFIKLVYGMWQISIKGYIIAHPHDG
jgi:hypothetical protein